MADSCCSTVTLRPPVWALFIAVAIGGGFYLAGKHIEARGPMPFNPAVISVSAEGKVTMSPDIASITLGVTSGRQTTAKAATEMVNKNMQKIVEAVTALGVAKKDIATEGFYLNPEFDYTTNGQVPRGFQASQTLKIKVRDLDKAGDVLTAATNAGANQVGGVVFSVDNPEEAQAKARSIAIEKAREKAEALATELKMHLGRMTGFSEGNTGYPMPMMMRATADMAVGGAPMEKAELPAGEQDIVSTVSLTYELR